MSLQTLFKNRFGLIAILWCVAIILFFGLRIALWSTLPTSITWTDCVAMLGLGFIKDVAAISYATIPFALWLLLFPQRWQKSTANKILYYAISIAVIYGLLFDLVAEWLFWDEFGARFNFIAVDYLVYRREVAGNISESYPVPLILSVLAVITAVLFVGLKRTIDKTIATDSTFKTRSVAAVTLLVIPAIAFAILPDKVNQFSTDNYANEIAGSGPYELFSAFRNNQLDYDRYYVMRDADKVAARIRELAIEPNASFTETDGFDIQRTITNSGVEKKLNVMMVVVESLSADYLTTFGSKDNITPNLDKLFDQGLLFSNLYATGTRTVRGLEALTLSLPPTPGSSVVKRPNNGNLFSLGFVLRDRGYDTKFLYGGFGYFDNMNTFFSGNGFDVVDRSQLSNEEIGFANIWGVADEDIFNRALKEADKSFSQGRPFMSLIMTTSNHRPYTYPAGKIDIPPGTGRAGAVKYTDYAIGQLIAAAKSHPWFDDTLFLIVADHCSGSAGKANIPIERYHIPAFFYAPKHILPSRNDMLASQIDLAPTLLGILNISYKSRFYGRDLLRADPKDGRALVATYDRLGLYKDNQLFILGTKQRATSISDPWRSALERHLKANDPSLDDVVTYYQSASYMTQNRLNTWIK